MGPLCTATSGEKRVIFSLFIFFAFLGGSEQECATPYPSQVHLSCFSCSQSTGVQPIRTERMCMKFSSVQSAPL